MSQRRASLEHLERHAVSHAVDWGAIDLSSPIDLERPFLCETLTPLYYTDVYAELTPEQKLRYNQLTGMSYNEIISFFEEHFAQNILHALTSSPHRHGLDPQLVDALIAFAEDERRHTRAFRALNQLSAPLWYRDSTYHILRPSPVGRRLIRLLTRRPARFPAVLWIALVMEERALAASRALLRRGEDEIEPHYLAVYQAHLQDEIRHVHLDWHLLEELHGTSSPFWRKVNAHLFAYSLSRFFLAPRRAGRRVIELLLVEHPELRTKRKRLLHALGTLSQNRAYHQMMYSREVTPIAFMLFDRCAEFRSLERSLLAYTPPKPDADGAVGTKEREAP